jgi:hypothetical protein
VLSESVALDRELVAGSASLLRQLDMQGPAMVEFKVDSRDGKPKLMEVNGRFWGSLQLAIDAGIDFPLLYTQLIQGVQIDPAFRYRSGVQSRWLLGDFDSFMIDLFSNAREKCFFYPRLTPLGSLVRFLRFFGSDLHYDVLSLDDPGPGWNEICFYLRTNIRLFMRMLASGSQAEGGTVHP